jgi:hypothetical protein
MRNLIDHCARRINDGMRTIGVIDPDLLMLPGGGLIALVLWLYEHRPVPKASRKV